MENFLILAINPGNSSTKIALYNNNKLLNNETFYHTDEELQKFNTVYDQNEFRTNLIKKFLIKNNIKTNDLLAIVGRGGLLRPLASGTYEVNDAMLNDLKLANRGEHASNLGAIIAHNMALEYKCKAYIVDPVAVDEMEDIARITGIKGIYRQSLSHALNMKAVAKRYAKELNTKYDKLNLIIAHLGSGTSLSIHSNGKMIDIINPKDEGPLSVDRAGTIPSSALIKMCFEKNANITAIQKLLFGEGGIYSHLQTKDVKEIIKKINDGNMEAKNIIEAMTYQIAKYIAQLASVVDGNVDAILLTGGMAHSDFIISKISKRVKWIAKIIVYAGEDELQALVEGTIRVLTEEEKPLIY